MHGATMRLGAVLVLLAGTAGCTPSAGDTNGDVTTPPGDTPVGDGDGDGGATDGDAALVCTDRDRDGYGHGCTAGGDCDDTDPARHDDCTDCATTHAEGCRCAVGDAFPCYEGPAGTEGVGVCAAGVRRCIMGILGVCEGQVLPITGPDTVCNDQDDDCDGDLDEAIAGPCGSCDPTCSSDGPVVPAVGDPGSSGLAPNPDGPGVVLGAEDIAAGFLWVANYDGTVSKLDLVTGAEVSRFYVGNYGNYCDSPSRTAVDGYGNAYVANRAHVCGGANQGVVTKMAGDERFCVDRNANTVIDTSRGSTPLPLGTDECVIWTAPVGGPGATLRGLAIDLGDESHPYGWPWVAAWTEMRAYKLDPDTGAVLTTVALNVNPYGLAADGLDGIWVSGREPSPGYLQRFDTVTGVVEERIQYGSSSGCNGQPYGITVDSRNRPWAACWIGSDACAGRWDPVARTWFAVHPGRGGWGGRGIAAAADGTIWMSIHQNWAGGAMASWNMEDGSGVAVRDIAGIIPVGIALDELDHVWTVNNSTSNVTRLSLLTGILEEFPVGPNPYTYSDFTGYQRRRLVPSGTWLHDYERCHRTDGDHWGLVSWVVTAPPGEITIAAQSAATEAGLETAPSVTLAVIPDDTPPVDVEAAFAAAGQPTYPFLRVTVTLEGTMDGRSPVFESIHLRWHCNILG